MTNKDLRFYREHAGPTYLELHALRAPVGRYLPEYATSSDLYDSDIMDAIRDFELSHDVTIYQLGRSGRHICIEDTPRNRRRFVSLSAKAIKAARDLWTSMREKEVSPDAET